MIETRNFDVILNDLCDLYRIKKQVKFDVLLPNDISQIYKHVGEICIGDDFKFLSYGGAKKINNILHRDFHELEDHFWVFAENRSGDLWLLSFKNMSPDSRVYFYDHGIEDYSSNNMLDMNISIEQWFVLADLVSQAYQDDYLDAAFRLKEPFREKLQLEMEKISSGLSEIYPFEI